MYFTKENLLKQFKSLALLLAVFFLTVSITSAVYQFTPPTQPEGVGDYGVPLTTGEIVEWKWENPMTPDFNLFVNSQGTPTANNINGLYGITQDGRYKEAVYSEKVLSFGDVITRPIISSLPLIIFKSPGFFEANNRESGTTGGDSWSVPGVNQFTYSDYNNIGRSDGIADDLKASADTLELFGGATGLSGLDDQINVINLKQTTSNLFPRFTVERTTNYTDYDAPNIPLFAKLRAGIIMAEKAILGQNVAPSNPAGNESTNPNLMAKINDSFVLTLEGTSNIGYGDTCQLYGSDRVADGCPDGWYMVNHTNDCQAKCRKISRIDDNNPGEYGRCPALATPESDSYKTDTSPITPDEQLGCINVVPPQCSDSGDNDSDGLVDYPSDPGCSSSTDNDETNSILTCTVNASLASKSFKGQVCISSPQTTNKIFSVLIDAVYDTGVGSAVYGSHSATITIPAGSSCSSINSPTATAVYTVAGSPPQFAYTSPGVSGGSQLSLPSSVFSVVQSSANSGGLVCTEL
jgi:hypothetical protein